LKHAGNQALDTLEDLLAELRKRKGLKEKKRGVFYRGSQAFLHFHEDPSGLFADLRSGERWSRHRVTTPHERRLLLQALEAELAG